MGSDNLRGSDVLDVIAFVEEKSSDGNAQLTLLSSAISMVAIRYGIRQRDLRRGVEQAFRQSIKMAPNYARAHGVTEEH